MNKKKKIKASTVVIYVFLSLMLVLYLAPLVWIGLTSFKSRPEIYKAPFGWPKAFHFENYAMAWKAGRLGIAMMNSLFVCVITLILTMVIGSMAAFAIARMRWKLAGAAMVYILIGMMIPVHCVLIPLFFRSIPNELLESACMDGCSIFQMFFKICFPLARTGLFVTGLMTFIGNWNELLLALVFVSDDTKKTLPVALTKFVTPYQTNYDKMFPAIMIAIIPTIVVYCMFSNQIVDGLTTGAVKG